MITVLVTGGRAYPHKDKVWAILDRLRRDNPSIQIVHGGCGTDGSDGPPRVSRLTGADAHAHAWATHNGVPVRVYSALWKTHGPKAGPIRNAQMVNDEKPALACAFAGGTGTAGCVKLCRDAGVPLIVVS